MIKPITALEIAKAASLAKRVEKKGNTEDKEFIAAATTSITVAFLNPSLYATILNI